MSSSISKFKVSDTGQVPCKLQRTEPSASSCEEKTFGALATSFGNKTIESLTASSLQILGSRVGSPALTSNQQTWDSVPTLDSMPDLPGAHTTTTITQIQCIKNMHELAEIIQLAATPPYDRARLVHRIETLTNDELRGEDSSPLDHAMRRIAAAVNTFITQGRGELLTSINESSSSVNRMPTTGSFITQGESLIPAEEPSLDFTFLSEQEKTTRAEHLTFFHDLATKDL